MTGGKRLDFHRVFPFGALVCKRWPTRGLLNEFVSTRGQLGSRLSRYNLIFTYTVHPYMLHIDLMFITYRIYL